MRMVFVQAGLGAGGAEKIVNMLALHREENGDTVDIVAINAKDSQSYFPYGTDVVVHTLGGHSAPRLVRSFLGIMRLRRLLRQLQPDVVLSFLTKVNVVVGMATAGFRVPVIMSERNNFQMQRMSLFWRCLSNLSKARGSRLVMQTEQARSFLPSRLQSRAVVIPNPVTPVSSRNCSAIGRQKFVAVGRLEEQKGFDLLLEAFARAASAIPSATLTIYGEGPKRATLEDQARKLGIADRVEMPGVTSSPQGWIDAESIFVLSSRFEGFPNVLLEALVNGMAAVAFDCPWGPSEILRSEYEYALVPAEDVARLSEALVRMATEANLKEQFRERAPKIALRYSQAQILAQWDEVIDLAASAHASSSRS